MKGFGGRERIGGGIERGPRPCARMLAWIVGLVLVAQPAAAASARFAAGGWGFDETTLAGLPRSTIDASTPFLTAGEAGAVAGLDVELQGSTVLCVLDAAGEACRAASPPPSGSFSVLVSFTVGVPEAAVSGPFTLMLTSLVAGRGYGPDDVAIPLDALAPASLDTTAVPGFDWTGELTPFVRVRDVSAAPRDVYDYIGWTVEDGATVTFRYDVPAGLVGNGYPQFTANAVPLVVPEPGAALLLGLGLAGLATGTRDLREARR
ncbi:MAG: PEP-CTERM sorting domain-containing protein [Myxococcota bacterium]